MADIKRLKLQYGQLEKHFGEWMPIMKDIQRLILPYHGRFDEKNTQHQKVSNNDKRFDDTATQAARILAAGMQGGLTSPSQRWFKLGFPDTALSRYRPVREWLDAVEVIMMKHFRSSNFYRMTVPVYKEISCFGTACLFEGEHSSGRGLWFNLITCGDYLYALDGYGNVGTVFRSDWLTADQIVRIFGVERVSQKIKKAYEKTPFQYFKVIHSVRPREKRDYSKFDSMQMAYESVYWEADAKEQQLAEGGYLDKPYMTPRWFTSGSMVYGVGPGVDALPTIRGTNTIKEDLLEAIEKEINPPVNIPPELAGNVDLTPGGENHAPGQTKVTETYMVQPNLSAGSQIHEIEKQTVKDWFFVNLFLLSTNPNATATEIAKKAQEQLIQLGPVLQGLFDEFLTPCIDRSFNILFRQGLIPEPPQEIVGAEMEIEFISTLAQAQKLVNVENNERWASQLLGIAGAVPSVLDIPNWDEWARQNANDIGIQAKLINSDDVIEAVRQQRAQAIEQQQMLEMQEQASRTGVNLANSKLEGDNVAKRMIDGVQQ